MHMRQVTDFFATSVDKSLFHYTGIGSLLGIAKSGKVWASHVYYLNDSKEIVHACDLLQNALEPRMVFDQLLTAEDRAFGDQFQSWAKSFYNTHYCLFVFSLSEKESLLSQWRSYTPHGKGVSIGFSPQLLDELIQTNDLKIARCVYDPVEQRTLLYGLFDKLLTTFRQERPTFNPSQTTVETRYFPFLERFRGEVLQVLAIMKHLAFEEEQEWRLITPYFPSYVTPSIQFREGASLLVPYTELSLSGSRPIFEKVILGPTAHENLSMSALSMFLSNQGICNQAVNSHIPYREW
jgi:hypothetical protein